MKISSLWKQDLNLTSYSQSSGPAYCTVWGLFPQGIVWLVLHHRLHLCLLQTQTWLKSKKKKIKKSNHCPPAPLKKPDIAVGKRQSQTQQSVRLRTLWAPELSQRWLSCYGTPGLDKLSGTCFSSIVLCLNRREPSTTDLWSLAYLEPWFQQQSWTHKRLLC